MLNNKKYLITVIAVMLVISTVFLYITFQNEKEIKSVQTIIAQQETKATEKPMTKTEKKLMELYNYQINNIKGKIGLSEKDKQVKNQLRDTVSNVCRLLTFEIENVDVAQLKKDINKYVTDNCKDKFLGQVRLKKDNQVYFSDIELKDMYYTDLDEKSPKAFAIVNPCTSAVKSHTEYWELSFIYNEKVKSYYIDDIKITRGDN